MRTAVIVLVLSLAACGREKIRRVQRGTDVSQPQASGEGSGSALSGGEHHAPHDPLEPPISVRPETAQDTPPRAMNEMTGHAMPRPEALSRR